MVKLKNIMANNMSRYLFVASLLIIFLTLNSCFVKSEERINTMNQNSYNNNEVQNKFNKLYIEWQDYISKIEISISSKSENYINCDPYIEIIKMGNKVLPYLIKKMEEGKESGWKEGQFFLWYAVRDITGIDFSIKNKLSSEQGIAEKYILWWKAKKE